MIFQPGQIVIIDNEYSGTVASQEGVLVTLKNVKNINTGLEILGECLTHYKSLKLVSKLGKVLA